MVALRIWAWVGAAALAASVAVSPAHAALMTYGFTNVTNNSAADVATGIAQMTVGVSDVGVASNQVKFIFSNSGPNASSITDVYFDDGTLLSVAYVIDGEDDVAYAGTKYAEGASPGELPGGSTINWNDEGGHHFSADSDPPAQPNGANPGESFAVVFDLLGGKTYADVIAAIALSLQPANIGTDVEGGLRIGIHVQGFAGDGSESFVNTTPPVLAPVVPEPGSMAMWGLGLALCGTVGYFRRLQKFAA